MEDSGYGIVDDSCEFLGFLNRPGTNETSASLEEVTNVLEESRIEEVP